MATAGDPDADEDWPDLRSYGRRRTRKLTARQQCLIDEVLPRFELDISGPPPTRLGTLSDPPYERIWLEIGFGGGEHIIWQARENSEVCLIGCEPFIDGTVKVLDAIDTHGITNLRLFADDARLVLRWLPAESLDRVFVLFPDPWPKKRHHKRRLINPTTINLLARALKPGAELRVATDIADYARTILVAMHGHAAFRWTARRPEDWRVRPQDWPPTRYEQKAIRERRRCYFLRFERLRGCQQTTLQPPPQKCSKK
ncbi:MAG: tRNA (guanosine(46)-N7)-methyltransferase TrmB [Hyphomicrobiaceae bacterium]